MLFLEFTNYISSEHCFYFLNSPIIYRLNTALKQYCLLNFPADKHARTWHALVQSPLLHSPRAPFISLSFRSIPPRHRSHCPVPYTKLPCATFSFFSAFHANPSSNPKPHSVTRAPPRTPATAMAMAAEGTASEPELVSIPATPHGLSTPEGAATPTGAGVGGGRSKGTGTPGRRVVDGLRGYLEDVGHLTRLDPRDAWLPVTESRGGNARYAAFHSLNAGLGFQALLLPLAFPGLGWLASSHCSLPPSLLSAPILPPPAALLISSQHCYCCCYTFSAFVNGALIISR